MGLCSSTTASIPPSNTITKHCLQDDDSEKTNTSNSTIYYSEECNFYKFGKVVSTPEKEKITYDFLYDEQFEGPDFLNHETLKLITQYYIVMDNLMMFSTKKDHMNEFEIVSNKLLDQLHKIDIEHKYFRKSYYLSFMGIPIFISQIGRFYRVLFIADELTRMKIMEQTVWFHRHSPECLWKFKPSITKTKKDIVYVDIKDTSFFSCMYVLSIHKSLLIEACIIILRIKEYI